MTLTVKRPNKDGTCQIFDVKEFKVSNEAYYSIYVALNASGVISVVF